MTMATLGADISIFSVVVVGGSTGGFVVEVGVRDEEVWAGVAAFISFCLVSLKLSFWRLLGKHMAALGQVKCSVYWYRDCFIPVRPDYKSKFAVLVRQNVHFWKTLLVYNPWHLLLSSDPSCKAAFRVVILINPLDPCRSTSNTQQRMIDPESLPRRGHFSQQVAEIT